MYVPETYTAVKKNSQYGNYSRKKESFEYSERLDGGMEIIFIFLFFNPNTKIENDREI